MGWKTGEGRGGVGGGEASPEGEEEGRGGKRRGATEWEVVMLAGGGRAEG